MKHKTHRGRLLDWHLLLVVLCAASFGAAEDLPQTLAFEGPHTSTFMRGWGGGPPGTLAPDSQIVYAGEYSARIERDESSEGEFSTLTMLLPMDFEGETIELRGFLRTEDVAGYAGLWLREDGAESTLEFDNMAGRGPSGTTEWKEYRIELPLNPNAHRLIFGVLLAGRGKAWADNLELRVDDVPYLGPPEQSNLRTSIAEDREFDGGSGLEISELTETQTEVLSVLGKLWGFLKYHHPRVARGETHWDYELFRILPRVLEAARQGSADQMILEWTRSVGEPEECDPCAAPPADVQLSADLGWIHDDSLLGAELSAFLQRTHRNRYARGVQAYVQKSTGAGHANFESESAYEQLQDLDTGYRILGLFRLWNITEYWFPYRDLVDDDWDAVLREFLPRIVAAEDRDSYALELMALIARVKDTHANLWSSLELRPPRGDCWLPMEVRFIDERAVVVGVTGEPSDRPPPRIGDVVEEIDAATVASLVSAWEPFYAASNRPTVLRDIARFLPRGACEQANVSVNRAGQRVDLTLRRTEGGRPARQDHNRPGDTYQRLSDEVAYLSLAKIQTGEAGGYIDDAIGARGLVIDIRNYPGAFVVFEIGQRLVKAPTPVRSLHSC